MGPAQIQSMWMQIRNPQVRSIRTLEHVLGDDPAVVRGYAKAASDAMGHGPLTLAERSRLLSRGERLGIRRFDANLILAAVEQQRDASGDHFSDVIPITPERRSWVVRVIMAAVGLQAAIATGAWWLLR